ncbi:MAG: hypothetical protein IH606_10105 [Burkholderiales bacterium]|nr:hypothetical protein [Burkholderiales bacterium]
MSRYLRLLAVFVVLLCAVLAGFNALIDPYGYFDPPKISGVNELPLGFNHRPLLAKSLAVSELRPATIILGNSRAEAAYDPQHPGIALQPAYNLSIGGAGLSMLRRYFLEALATGGLRQVILALDLTMFDPAANAANPGLDAVLLTDAEGKPASEARKWQRLAFVLFSGSTSSDSWWSYMHQRKPVAIYTRSGLREEAYDIAQVAREGGPRRASLRVEASFLAGTLRDVESEKFRASYATTLAALREILDLSAKRGVHVTLIINPIHARQTYTLAAAGLWPLYEVWKGDLLATAQRAPKLVSLWDFSGVSSCTAENLPADAAAQSAMRWYRESSHFRRVLGNRVLDRVFGRPDDGVCRGLGQQLETATLVTALAAQRGALRHWVETHAVDVAEIEGLAKQYGRISRAH